jgi:hypothetical protein
MNILECNIATGLHYPVINKHTLILNIKQLCQNRTQSGQISCSIETRVKEHHGHISLYHPAK